MVNRRGATDSNIEYSMFFVIVMEINTQNFIMLLNIGGFQRLVNCICIYNNKLILNSIYYKENFKINVQN